VGEEGDAADEVVEGEQRRLGRARQWADHDQRGGEGLRRAAQRDRLLPPDRRQRRVVQLRPQVRLALDAVLLVEVREKVVEALPVPDPVHELDVAAGGARRRLIEHAHHERRAADLADRRQQLLEVVARVLLVRTGQRAIHPIAREGVLAVDQRQVDGRRC